MKFENDISAALYYLWCEGWASGESGDSEFGLSWAHIKIPDSDLDDLKLLCLIGYIPDMPLRQLIGDWLVTENSDGLVASQPYNSATWQSLETAYQEYLADHTDEGEKK